jgi:L-histidine Nalpha-methyltransferase
MQPTNSPVTHRPPEFVQLHHDDPQAVRRALLTGIEAQRATVAPKFLYDSLGSKLFEAITELDEYYPTRTEAAILQNEATGISQAIGEVGTLIDLGAGNCAKAGALFDTLRPQRYVAVDIAVDFLRAALERLAREHPRIEMAGLGVDFSDALSMPEGWVVGRPVFFYPGSSIGNFPPTEAREFLRRVHEQSAGGGLLIGVDLVKPITILEPAYDDALGVTAAFNLNLLLHLNRLVGTDFRPREWRHVGIYNADEQRIEMHLEARVPLQVTWPDGSRRFAAGERIHTESSHKYTLDGFGTLLRDAGYRQHRHWTDPDQLFAVFWASA